VLLIIGDITSDQLQREMLTYRRIAQPLGLFRHWGCRL